MSQHPKDMPPELSSGAAHRAAALRAEAVADEREALQRADEANDPDPELDSVGDDRLKRVLELNGFNAIQTEALGVVAAVAAVPLEALDAALLYHDAALARLQLNPGPHAKDMRVRAERHGRYLHSVRRWRRELGELEERLAATERITTP